MISETKIFIQRGVRCDGVAIYVDNIVPGKRSVADPLTFTEVHEYAADGLPTFNLTEAETQHLMDQLWDSGIRPTVEVGTTKQVGAIQNHLADMQKLVFGYDTKMKKGA